MEISENKRKRKIKRSTCKKKKKVIKQTIKKKEKRKAIENKRVLRHHQFSAHAYIRQSCNMSAVPAFLLQNANTAPNLWAEDCFNLFPHVD